MKMSAAAIFSSIVQSNSTIPVYCCDLRASVDEKSGYSNTAYIVKRGTLMLISGVDISSMVLQQLCNGLILCKVKRVTLILISGMDINSCSC